MPICDTSADRAEARTPADQALLARAAAAGPAAGPAAGTTGTAAELLGLKDHVGTLESGKFADIIAVPGDASKDAKALQHALFVMKSGEIVKRPN